MQIRGMRKYRRQRKDGWTTDIELSSDGDSYYQFTATTLAVNSKSLKDSNYFATSTKITQGEAKYDTVEDLLKLQRMCGCSAEILRRRFSKH